MSLAKEEGYPHEGYLDFSSSTVNTSTGTLLVRGVFPNPDGRMRPGQYARVRLPIGKEKAAILVPEAAVGYDQLGNYLLIVNENNIVERRNVKTGAQKEHMYEIEEGLNGDEWVVTIGLLKAIPGKQVTPERCSTAGRGGKTRSRGWQMISEFFVDRPIFANVIAFVTIIIGLVALFHSRSPNIHRSFHRQYRLRLDTPERAPRSLPKPSEFRSSRPSTESKAPYTCHPPAAATALIHLRSPST